MHSLFWSDFGLTHTPWPTSLFVSPVNLVSDATTDNIWLLNIYTYRLEHFVGDKIPKYAILSHTWEQEDVSFQVIQDLATAKQKAGFGRSSRLDKRTARRLSGVDHAWVDTCCIDKTSSSELQEAINSMFRWYQNATVCFVYLSDVHMNRSSSAELAECRPFANSRWFTRGWTLHELIAPRGIWPFNGKWVNIDHRGELASLISAVTAVPAELLASTTAEGQPLQIALQYYSVAQRMSWASSRQTTRIEDLIFGVAMPMLYGGGGSAAFIRLTLQSEIMRASNDLPIFAWRDLTANSLKEPTLVSDSPDRFADCSFTVKDGPYNHAIEFASTNAGLRAGLFVRLTDGYRGFGSGLVVLLHCHDQRDLITSLALRVRSTEDFTREQNQQIMSRDTICLCLGWHQDIFSMGMLQKHSGPSFNANRDSGDRLIELDVLEFRRGSMLKTLTIQRDPRLNRSARHPDATSFI